MTMGLVGRKCGMTRVFAEDGVSIPVTVIEAQPNKITQVKTIENDGIVRCKFQPEAVEHLVWLSLQLATSQQRR